MSTLDAVIAHLYSDNDERRANSRAHTVFDTCIIEPLLGLLKSPQCDSDMQMRAMRVLRRLTCPGELKRAIHAAGAVPLIITALQSGWFACSRFGSSKPSVDVTS
jgi:hypothetical protein